MARFDVYALPHRKELALDIQSDFVDFLPTRLVVPLVGRDYFDKLIPQMHFPIRVNGTCFYMATHMAAAIPASLLKKPIANAADHSTDITAAIDFLLQGF